MFKELFGAEIGLQMLKVYKKVFDANEENIGGTLDCDYEFDCAFSAIYNLSDDIVFYGLDDYPGNVMYKITFEGMPVFFDLCKRYAKNHGVSFKNTRYYQDLDMYIDTVLDRVDQESMLWKLVAPKRILKKKTYHLFVEVCGDYFANYLELAMALYDIAEHINYLSRELSDVLTKENNIIRLEQFEEKRKKAA